MMGNPSEGILANVASLALVLILISSSRVSTSQPVYKSQDNMIHNLNPTSLSSSASRLGLSRELSSAIPLVGSLSSLGKSRKVREIREGDVEDMQAMFNQDYSASPSQHEHHTLKQLSSSSSPKVKAIYPPLSGSGELFRLFRPLALSPEKTIGMTKWYLPGFGYFSRGGRASSSFIRFGRSGMLSNRSVGGSTRFVDEDDDVSLLNKNNAKKKNNFIRLGRENPRQTNFIRLGRSGNNGGSSQVNDHLGGEFYNTGYITPSLSDSFRGATGTESLDDNRQDFN